MLEQLKDAISFSALNPHDKHVDVLLKSSALCREMSAITAILCKSGKGYIYTIFAKYALFAVCSVLMYVN